jgi:hypothetical protein
MGSCPKPNITDMDSCPKPNITTRLNGGGKS